MADPASDIVDPIDEAAAARAIANDDRLWYGFLGLVALGVIVSALRFAW